MRIGAAVVGVGATVVGDDFAAGAVVASVMTTALMGIVVAAYMIPPPPAVVVFAGLVGLGLAGLLVVGAAVGGDDCAVVFAEVVVGDGATVGLAVVGAVVGFTVVPDEKILGIIVGLALSL